MIGKIAGGLFGGKGKDALVEQMMVQGLVMNYITSRSIQSIIDSIKQNSE